MSWTKTTPEGADTTNWYARKAGIWQKLPAQGVWVPSSGDALLSSTYSAAAPQVDNGASLGTTGLGWSALRLSDGATGKHEISTNPTGNALEFKSTGNINFYRAGASHATWTSTQARFVPDVVPFSDASAALGATDTVNRGWSALHLSDGTYRVKLNAATENGTLEIGDPTSTSPVDGRLRVLNAAGAALVEIEDFSTNPSVNFSGGSAGHLRHDGTSVIDFASSGNNVINLKRNVQPSGDGTLSLGNGTNKGWAALHLSNAGATRVKLESAPQVITGLDNVYVGDRGGTDRGGLFLKSTTNANDDTAMCIYANSINRLQFGQVTSGGTSITVYARLNNTSFYPGNNNTPSLGQAGDEWHGLHLTNGTGAGALTVDDSGNLLWNGVQINP